MCSSGAHSPSREIKIAKAPVPHMRKMKERSKERHLQDDLISNINTYTIAKAKRQKLNQGNAD